MVSFGDILIAEDAPWDPVTLSPKFKPLWLCLRKVAMIIATLSTNIAANVIAPANVFSNLFPRRLRFVWGRLDAGAYRRCHLPGCFWMKSANALLLLSGLLGPVLGVMLCDYFVILKPELNPAEMYKPNGMILVPFGL